MLEKEMKYKYLDADDFHSESNKGVYMSICTIAQMQYIFG